MKPEPSSNVWKAAIGVLVIALVIWATFATYFAIENRRIAERSIHNSDLLISTLDIANSALAKQKQLLPLYRETACQDGCEASIDYHGNMTDYILKANACINHCDGKYGNSNDTPDWPK